MCISERYAYRSFRCGRKKHPLMPHARAHTRRHEQLTRANCRGRSTKRTHNRVIQIPCSGRAACGTGKLKLRLQRRKAQRANWEGKFQAIEINGIRVAKLTSLLCRYLFGYCFVTLYATKKLNSRRFLLKCINIQFLLINLKKLRNML